MVIPTRQKQFVQSTAGTIWIGAGRFDRLRTGWFDKSTKIALVSDQSGTTRDFLIAKLQIQGLEFLLIDTAGVEEEEEGAEGSGATPISLGQIQSDEQEKESDITLFCLDGSRQPNEWERQQLTAASLRRIVCLNKSDLPPANGLDAFDESLRLSAQTGYGIEDLADRLVSLATKSGGAEAVPSTAVRCGAVVDDALGLLDSAANLVTASVEKSLIAGEIRLALDAIGRINGCRIYR